ncbi:15072_t:CDS:2 [Gigaspora rosea]|nr:15072_t:CDS:2 [Gigaspora rosea]
MGILNNCQPLISGTDVFHCIKKEHLWYLKEKYGNKSGLTNEVLNPKNKQADELAKRFFSSNVLKAIVQHATEYNDDSFYGDALYHFFAGLLLESWKSRSMDHLNRIRFAWAAVIFFATTRY